MGWPEAPETSNTLGWSELRHGQLIEVLDSDLIVSRGVVDDFTSDRQVVWLRLSYGTGRQVFHQRDGWQLRAVRGTP
ncbi:hypothetical protein GCM10007170_35850 [Arthrobacter liuii]|jgi:hypothetical protein|uniref:Uncharacterized protein n=1 Tax=Arthrobacter liuii TaxID=1476996 RepID=A0ABQ2AYW3_9MICC|nr:hypothetical protein GCM10007170_35850 [Arthrobacter liuii]